MRAYKVELLVLDDQNTKDMDMEIINILDSNKYLNIQVMSVTGKKVRNWEENHPLNGCCKDYFDEFFL